MTEATETQPKTEAIAVTRRIQRPGIEETRVEKLRRVVEEASDAGPFSILVAQIDPDDPRDALLVSVFVLPVGILRPVGGLADRPHEKRIGRIRT